MLEIKNIYKTFNAGTVNEKRALNGLSLNLEDGDFVTSAATVQVNLPCLMPLQVYGRWMKARSLLMVLM